MDGLTWIGLDWIGLLLLLLLLLLLSLLLLHHDTLDDRYCIYFSTVHLDS